MDKKYTQSNKLSNTETFNKFLLTIATSSFPILYYFIKEGSGWIFGFKLSLALFGLSLLMTMLALILACDYPELQGWIGKFVYWLDWIGFFIFSLALVITYFSIF